MRRLVIPTRVLMPAGVLIAALVLAVSSTGSASADSASYAAAPRLAYVERALAALQSMTPAGTVALEDALQVGARSRCKATYGRPPVSCLLQVARDHCDARPAAERATCHLVADLALTNQLAEMELVDDKTRIRLMNKSGGFRAAMRAELRSRYAELAAEMLLTSKRGTPVERIDAFCSGTRRTLPWQRCVAAIVWYVGTDQGAHTRPEESP